MLKHAEKTALFLFIQERVDHKVLGTAFNFKASYPGRENVVVSVSRGKVQVNYGAKKVAMLTQGQLAPKVSNKNKPVVQKNIAVSEAAPCAAGVTLV